MAAKAKIEDKELPLEARVIQCINGFKAPLATQDTVDQYAAEFATANLLRTYAEKRYDTIKKAVVGSFETEIALVRNAAVEQMQKSTHSMVGEDWQLDFAANKPALRTDVDELRTELIKRGVNVTTIDEAINKVSKKSTPALIVSAKPVV
jgi:hypothetical protein